MADLPVKELGGKTPLESAYKPVMDSLAPYSLLGTVKTVPDSLSPGSDVANLAVLGYNTEQCYTGRSPFEAVSLGIAMGDEDTAIRCNTITLSDEPNFIDKTILDYSAGNITTEESNLLIRDIAARLNTNEYGFYPGASYKHCFILKKRGINSKLTSPLDIADRKIGEYLPKDRLLFTLMKEAAEILKNHPVNLDRKARQLHPANSIWFWGKGKKPVLENFNKKFNLDGSIISAVDLIKGIGIYAGLEVIDVKGSTGTLDTNYGGKCNAALDALLNRNKNFVYIHCEAPDECGHHGDYSGKKLAIERIDRYIIAPLINALKNAKEDFSLLILPDHPTPVSLKNHISDPVPFLLYRSDSNFNSGKNIYCEASCNDTDTHIEKGYMLIRRLLL